GAQAAAEANFRKAIDIDPKSVPAYLALANFFWSTNRLRDAESTLKTALALSPKDIRANRALALTMLSEGRLPEVQPYLLTLSLFANDTDSRLALADYYIATTRNGDAEKVRRELTPHSKLVGVVSLRLAAMQLGEKRAAEAGKTLEDLLLREPNNADALALQAQILLAQQKLVDALATASKAA